jgi:eukaryotic-like serine/threonine-protein kinase
MTPERWQQVNEIFQAAIELEGAQRTAFLDNSCAGDKELRSEVESLITSDQLGLSFIDEPAFQVAAGLLASDKPELKEGQCIGHYEIVGLLGRGGMGEVYLAKDGRLKRRIALKLLPSDYTRDRARLRRFQQEAQAASALNHPNIVTIHEIGEVDGQHFIVNEFIDGETLRQRLHRARLGLQEALEIAIQVASALAAAHQAGIVHRDIKPENIMLRPDGYVKVLDFGLAKLTEQYERTPPAREGDILDASSGLLMGTVIYMSPEQARGLEVNSRSDIFSLGVVLYEMIAGVHPFRADTMMDTAEAILKDTPQPLCELIPDIPVLLQHIVTKMLAQDPDDRYQSIHDVRTDLRELVEESNHSVLSKRRRMKLLYWIAATAVIVVGAGIGTFFQFYPREMPLPPPRFVPVTTSIGEKDFPSISPDGNLVAFQWKGEKRDNWDIYVKEVDGTGFNRLTTDPADDCCPAWSPDGRQIAFLRASGDLWILYLINPLGGVERRVTEVSLSGQLGWSPDGKKIAFRDRKLAKDPWSIWLLSLETLEKRQMTTPGAGYHGDRQPAFSPDGRYLAFARRSESGTSALYVMELPGGEPKLVTNYNSPVMPSWTVDSREIVFASSIDPWDCALYRIFVSGGDPRRVLARGEYMRQPTISRNRMVYLNVEGKSHLWRLELNGDKGMKTPSSPLLLSSSLEADKRISPDGSRIAFISSSSGNLEIWVCNADGTKPLKLTDMKARMSGSPTWSPDGNWIAFDSNKSGNIDIYMVSSEGGRVRQLTSDPTDEAVPCWSRDGYWIYFGSNRSGSWQIWRMPSDGGKPIQITNDGGHAARESADGQFLYYYGFYDRQKKGIWRVPVSGGQETPVLDKEIMPLLWDLTDRGIYFIDRNARPVATICFYDFGTRHIGSLGPVHSDPRFQVNRDGFSVSPDGKWLLYSGGIFNYDIIMIDNFR